MSEVQTKTAEAPAQRGPMFYKLRPQNVRLNAENFLNRTYFVHLNADMTFQDLFDHPDAWSEVQTSSRALRKYDTLTVFMADESQMAECVVMAANASSVSLSKPRITQLEARTAASFETPEYAVRFDGANGWRVWKKDIQSFVTNGTTSEIVAREELMRLYPRKA